jgi:hypothetical protein
VERGILKDDKKNPIIITNLVNLHFIYWRIINNFITLLFLFIVY